MDAKPLPRIDWIERMKRVLILCTGNSCRSQMAEALWEKIGDPHWKADSAGSKPSGYVHPLAIRAMQEVDIDISACESKSIDRFLEESFDLVVTVCDNAKQSCPIFPGAEEIVHCPFDDPADATGDDDEQMITFRRVRDEIKAKIEEYLRTH